MQQKQPISKFVLQYLMKAQINIVPNSTAYLAMDVWPGQYDKITIFPTVKSRVVIDLVNYASTVLIYGHKWLGYSMNYSW